MESRARAASQPYRLLYADDLRQATTSSTCHPVFTTILGPQLPHLLSHPRLGSGDNSSFLVLSPNLAQSFLEMTLAACVPGILPFGAHLWNQQLGLQVGQWCPPEHPLVD